MRAQCNPETLMSCHNSRRVMVAWRWWKLKKCTKFRCRWDACNGFMKLAVNVHRKQACIACMWLASAEIRTPCLRKAHAAQLRIHTRTGLTNLLASRFSNAVVFHYHVPILVNAYQRPRQVTY